MNTARECNGLMSLLLPPALINIFNFSNNPFPCPPALRLFDGRAS